MGPNVTSQTRVQARDPQKALDLVEAYPAYRLRCLETGDEPEALADRVAREYGFTRRSAYRLLARCVDGGLLTAESARGHRGQPTVWRLTGEARRILALPSFWQRLAQAQNAIRPSTAPTDPYLGAELDAKQDDAPPRQGRFAKLERQAEGEQKPVRRAFADPPRRPADPR